MPKKGQGGAGGRGGRGGGNGTGRSGGWESRLWFLAALGIVLAVSTALWKRRSGKRKEADDEAPINPQALVASMTRVQESKPVTLAEIDLQLRFFCGDELAILDLDVSPSGPPSNKHPADEKCKTYVKSLTRVAKSLEIALPGTIPRLTRSTVKHLDRRLAAIARYQLDFDAYQTIVVQLGAWLSEHGEQGVWFSSAVPLLVSHLLHGDEQPRWEEMLTDSRSNVLSRVAERMDSSGVDLVMAASVACQATLSDFAWRVTANEEALTRQLASHLMPARLPTDDLVRFMLSALGAYKPLLPIVERWSSLAAWRAAYRESQARSGAEWPFWQLWRLSVEEPLTERELRKTFVNGSDTALGPGGAATPAVRDMYEASPYPKWSWMHPEMEWPPKVYDWLHEKNWEAPATATWKSRLGERVKVLISGCGTGKWLTHFARHYSSDADIWAVDLSLSSLSFAKRKAEEIGLTNVRFMQGDILALPEALRNAGPFDVIEAGGMLHHLREPLEGWRKLTELLRPGGVMLVALYSKIARSKHVDPCRNFATQGGYDAASPESLRKYRTDVFAKMTLGESWAQSIASSSDFSTLNGLRDLCFHVQETQYTMLEIEHMLGELELRWLQMAETINEEKQALFKQKHGVDAFSKAATPTLWHAFEQKYPTTFLGMYEFFVQSCREGACAPAPRSSPVAAAAA